MKLYVGTYAKYNAGSIAGKWLDLDKFKNGKEFEAACRRIHSDESEPEFMFQDVETDPGCDWQEGLYSEGSIPWDYWRLKKEFQSKPMRRKSKDAEEQDRLAAEYTTLYEGYTREKYPKSWDKEYKYWRSIGHFVKLSDGVILYVRKPGIQTRFCCGEDDRGQGGDGYGTMKFAHEYLEHKRTELGFKDANLVPFDEEMISYFGRKAWRRAKHAEAHGIPPYDDRIREYIPCLMRGIYRDGRIYLGNAVNDGGRGGESIVRFLTDDEIRMMRHAYMLVRTAFKKRLNAYWKRFGASKIHTWTYWTEA